METQESITRWADDTFGPKHPAEVAARMNVEVAELVAGLATVAAVPVADMDQELVQELQKECADVFIMLAQVAEKLNVDLQTVVDFKMSVNRNRSWGRSRTGKMQHVETFLDPGSGLEMELDKFYIISDSGSFFTAQGFDSADQALNWAQSADGIAAGAQDAVVPTFQAGGFFEGQDGVNIYLGRELRAFWKANPLCEGEPA
ncbi:putative pyrophosphatase [Pseudomonas phage LKO4]|uniref:Putative pyrophosphatase n=1 Tax=Pseudomonas phage LKO4 TaxID=1308899 RepID=A0A0U1UKX0_9CAUD|nr:putative pyrophosphatase [Pseudomonas phage LKO4]AGI11272.1 putative pyrophosphatase [Pseudomonas phage LKO4]